MKRKRYLLFFVFLLGCTILNAQSDEIKVRVDGLSCPFCAYTLEKKITESDIVEKLNFDFDEGIMFLTLKGGRRISDETIKKIVDESGFTVRKIIRQDLRE